MIIQIDDQYFNPLTITTLSQEGKNVRVWFDNDISLLFTIWTVSDLAAEINRCIEEFNKNDTSQS